MSLCSARSAALQTVCPLSVPSRTQQGGTKVCMCVCVLCSCVRRGGGLLGLQWYKFTAWNTCILGYICYCCCCGGLQGWHGSAHCKIRTMFYQLIHFAEMQTAVCGSRHRLLCLRGGHYALEEVTVAQGLAERQQDFPASILAPGLYLFSQLHPSHWHHSHSLIDTFPRMYLAIKQMKTCTSSRY